jgi:hypothetical protein
MILLFREKWRECLVIAQLFDTSFLLLGYDDRRSGCLLRRSRLCGLLFDLRRVVVAVCVLSVVDAE